MSNSTTEQDPTVIGARLADRMKEFLAEQVHNTAELDDRGHLVHRDLETMIEYLVEDDEFFDLICQMFEAVADRHLEDLQEREQEDLWHDLAYEAETSPAARGKLSTIRSYGRAMRKIDQYEEDQRRSA